MFRNYQRCMFTKCGLASVPVMSLSLRFNGHFPGGPGLAGVYCSKGWWRWWWQLDNWSYKSYKAAVKSSPTTNQNPFIYRPDTLPVAQPTVSKHWREKISHSMDLLTQSSPGGPPTLSLTTNGSYLPWGRVAMSFISPLMPVPQSVPVLMGRIGAPRWLRAAIQLCICVCVSVVMQAPFVPFLTEHMYQNLRHFIDSESTKTTDTRSVHYLMLPQPK